MNRVRGVSGIVLAGGLSTRIGHNKSNLALGEKPVVQRTLEALDGLFEELIYVTNRPETIPVRPRLKSTPDETANLGPLGGILSGLKISDAPRSLIVACDMPFLSQKLMRFLTGYDLNADVVLPVLSKGPEPLHAVYSRVCIPFIERSLKQGNSRIRDFFKDVKVAVVGESELKAEDPELFSFFNINTRDDLKHAKEMLHRYDPNS